MLMKNLKLFVCLATLSICSQAFAIDTEARGKVSLLMIGYPFAPMTLAIKIADTDGNTDYPANCPDVNSGTGFIIADMSGDNVIDREDTQAFFSLLQTAAVTGLDVVVYYHISGGTYTEDYCVIDAVAIAP